MFQENIKKIEIKNTLSTTKTNSHPFNASDKYHVCVGSSTIKTELQASKQQASEQVQAAAAAIKHYHRQRVFWKPKYQILKKFVGVK